MTPEQRAALRAELTEDPEKFGYVQFIPDGPGHLVDLLNAQTETMVKSRFVSARTVLAEMPLTDAATFLETLEVVAEVNPVVKWGMRFLTSDLGIDIGHPNTQMLLDGLATGGAMTQTLADQAKALAMQPASRAEVLLGAGTQVDESDVRAVLKEIG
jgi:hypothetical protein